MPLSRAQAQAPTAKLVRLPFPSYDGTLTPYTFELGYPLVTLVYDTLLSRDAQGAPRPWLARSIRRSRGGRRLTLKLQNGVRWADGRRVTAADVAFTFGLFAARYQPRFTPQLTDVQRVQATGPLTVTIDLRRKSLGFDDQPLADMPIVPKHLWGSFTKSGTPPGLPVGSGPYRLVGADRRRGYTLRANTAYFKGPPRVERIRVPIVRQEQRTYIALRQRRVDMLPISLPEGPAQDLGGAFGINVSSGPLYTGTGLLLNLRRAPFNNAAARRAVASALDLGRIVSNVGPGIPADRGYIHPASPWSSDRQLHRFDAPAARRAIARLRLPAIPVLVPSNDPQRIEAGRQVVLALHRAGAKARLAKVPRARLSRATGEDGSSPDFEAAIVSVPPLASYDPDFLGRLFGSDPRAAPLNRAGYRNKAFDALAERVASAPDRRARVAATHAELRLLARDLPVIPLFFPKGAFPYRPAIYDGWVFIKGAGILDKRSFVPGGRRSETRPGPGREPAKAPDDSGSTLDFLSQASLVVLAIALVLAGVALIRRRSLRR